MLGGDGGVALPVSVTFEPSGDGLGPIEVTATGHPDGALVVTQVRELSFARGKSVVLRMDLVRSCAEATAPVCDDDQTCVDGECEGRGLDVDDLPAYDGPDSLGSGMPARDGGARDGGAVGGTHGGDDGGSGTGAQRDGGGAGSSGASDGGGGSGGSGGSGAGPDAGPDEPCEPVDETCNGRNDDCDGVIDSAKAGAIELTITAVQRAEAAGEVRLDLQAEAGAAVPEQATQRSASRGPAVNVSRLDLSALPRGRYRLTASRQGAEPEPAELFLAVSLATRGASHAYLVHLGATETRTLGVIEVP
jgi:hypothetical protein